MAFVLLFFAFLSIALSSPIVILYLQLSSLLSFFFFSCQHPRLEVFEEQIAISLKIIRVNLLAEVLALEKHQVFKAGKVLGGSVLGFQGR